MAKQAQAVSFDETMIEDTLASIKDIDGRLAEVLGTQAERLKVARMSVLAEDLPTAEDMPTLLDLTGPSDFHMVTWGDVLDYIEGPMASWLAEVDQVAGEAVDQYLRDHKSANADEVDGLKEQRATLVERAKALGTLLGVEVDIPKRSGGGSSSGTVKVSGAHFYVVLDGKRKDFASSQDKLSSVAWYNGRALCPDCTPANKDKGVSVGDLSKAIEAALGGPIPATDWEVVLNGNTVGMQVLTPNEEG